MPFNAQLRTLIAASREIAIRFLLAAEKVDCGLPHDFSNEVWPSAGMRPYQTTARHHIAAV